MIVLLVKAIVTESCIVSGHRLYQETCCFPLFTKAQRSLHILFAARNLVKYVSVIIDAIFDLISPWSIMVVEESCSLVDLYTGIQDGNVEVLFTSSCNS